jgi:hypothetical protein
LQLSGSGYFLLAEPCLLLSPNVIKHLKKKQVSDVKAYVALLAGQKYKVEYDLVEDRKEN